MHAIALVVVLLLARTVDGRRSKESKGDGTQRNRYEDFGDLDADSQLLKPGDKAASNDLYERLEVAKDATVEQIQKNYKKAALKWHPDKNIDKQEHAQKMFQKINEANEILSDPEKRKRYDLGGLDAANDPNGGGGGNPFGRGGGGRNPYGSRYGNASQYGGGNPFGAGGGNPFGGGGGMSQEQAEAMMRELFGDQFGGGGGNPFGGGGGNPFGGSQRFPGRQQQRQRQEPHFVLPSGTAVMLRSLVNSPQLNHHIGRVVRFDAERHKYQVNVDGADSYVKRGNLLQQCTVRIVGLKSKPEFNGESATVHNFHSDTGRYGVQTDRSGTALRLRPANCLLEPGTRVVLEGLSNPKFNGQGAQIIDIDQSIERYVVVGEDGKQIKIKYENVLC